MFFGRFEFIFFIKQDLSEAGDCGGVGWGFAGQKGPETAAGSGRKLQKLVVNVYCGDRRQFVAGFNVVWFYVCLFFVCFNKFTTRPR